MKALLAHEDAADLAALRAELSALRQEIGALSGRLTQS